MPIMFYLLEAAQVLNLTHIHETSTLLGSTVAHPRGTAGVACKKDSCVETGFTWNSMRHVIGWVFMNTYFPLLFTPGWLPSPWAPARTILLLKAGDALAFWGRRPKWLSRVWSPGSGLRARPWMPARDARLLPCSSHLPHQTAVRGRERLRLLLPLACR